MKTARAALLVPLTLLLSPILLVLGVSYWTYRIALQILVWFLWIPEGKDVLLVYSDSPVWHEYMTTHILPLVQERAIILNWSKRKEWRQWSLEVRVFSMFAGRRNFNPMVILFRPFCRVKLFRFFPAFKEWKHGKTRRLEQLRADLAQAL